MQSSFLPRAWSTLGSRQCFLVETTAACGVVAMVMDDGWESGVWRKPRLMDVWHGRGGLRGTWNIWYLYLDSTLIRLPGNSKRFVSGTSIIFFYHGTSIIYGGICNIYCNKIHLAGTGWYRNSFFGTSQCPCTPCRVHSSINQDTSIMVVTMDNV